MNRAKKKIAQKTDRCLQLLQTAVLLLCVFAFIQRIKLLQDLGVFQLDDLAGEVVQGVFLRHIQKADAYRAKTRRIPCISSTHTLASNSDYSTHAAEFIEIPADYFPNADYCLRLTTNMLHPIYIKDDIIAVEQNFPHFGDIALFLNENGVEMIRKYTEKDGSPYLEAVSRCDRSLYLTSDIICLGTILGIVRLEDTRKPPIT